MHIKELMKRFEEIMSSAAFAEAGEFETAKRMLYERHKVLLVLTGMETDMKAAKYAFNTSKRMGARIEILYLAQNGEEKSFLEKYLRELKAKGIEYQITQCEGSLKEEINRFIEKEKDIQFVVIDSEDVGMRSAKDQKTALDDWHRLKCPVVLVSQLARE
jgi:hypothetical protein